jgi:hypothetical protein
MCEVSSPLPVAVPEDLLGKDLAVADGVVVGDAHGRPGEQVQVVEEQRFTLVAEGGDLGPGAAEPGRERPGSGEEVLG